jgi:N-acetylneuraminate synthase
MNNAYSEQNFDNGKSEKIYVIAELGINHDGSLELAKKLIDQAFLSGANAIKFQYRNLLNAYSEDAKEIGDEMLKAEIHKNYISPEDIMELHFYAKNQCLDSGISFFDVSDIRDFGSNIDQFDFFKIPSAELMNVDLINFLLNLNKNVYISTGCHSEVEIEKVFTSLKGENWVPLHCISNYPTMSQNARLGYITYLQNKWNKGAGYSSHDDDWAVCLLAMQLGAVIIERHITLDKCGDGLDHTSSSTPDEFAQICFFAKHISSLVKGNTPRVVNQGELLNRQNLGRSFYAKSDIEKGKILSFDDLDYRSPSIGLNKSNISGFIGRETIKELKSGAVVSESFFDHPLELTDEAIEFARKNKVALPVRLHDIEEIESSFPIGAYEFHLSYEEAKSKRDTTKYSSSNYYSVHLPDYISPTLLMDPFSRSAEQRKESLFILDKTVELTKKLQDITGENVTIVGSFSLVHSNNESFFDDYKLLLDKYTGLGVSIMPQWLPPIAWYFGGSVKLDVMNSLGDIDYLKKLNIPICMDFCHLIMCKNYDGLPAARVIDMLSENIGHIHIADAVGIDGEGIAFGDGEPENVDIIRKAFDYNCMKVIEVWQGHLNEGAGFRSALLALKKLYNE